MLVSRNQCQRVLFGYGRDPDVIVRYRPTLLPERRFYLSVNPSRVCIAWYSHGISNEPLEALEIFLDLPGVICRRKTSSPMIVLET